MIRVRVRVTELVYQIGFTTLFRSQGGENILVRVRVRVRFRVRFRVTELVYQIGFPTPF